MSIVGLLITLLLAVIAIVMVAYPLFRSPRENNAAADSLLLHQDRLRTYYERVVTNIRDLDEDLATGKIGEDNHRKEREVWVHRGMQLLRMQDQLDAEHGLANDASDVDEINKAIEAAVAFYREDEQTAFHNLSAKETS